MTNAALNIENEVISGSAVNVGQETLVPYTVADYIAGYVNFPVPEDALRSVLHSRGIGMEAVPADVDEKTLELAKADVMLWICRGMSSRSSVVDRDNSWSHQDGGFTLSQEDKKALRAEAKAIYDKFEESFPLGVKVRTVSHGIRHCDYDLDGTPLPHNV